MLHLRFNAMLKRTGEETAVLYGAAGNQEEMRWNGGNYGTYTGKAKDRSQKRSADRTQRGRCHAYYMKFGVDFLVRNAELPEINSFEEICKCSNTKYLHSLGDQRQVGKVCKQNKSSVRRQHLHG